MTLCSTPASSPGPDTADRHATLVDPGEVATGMIANPVRTPDGSTLACVALTANGFQLWSVDVQREASGAETFGVQRQITRGTSVDGTSPPMF